MTVFYHEEPENPSKRCKFFSSCLKEAFSHCNALGVKQSTPSPEDENPASDCDDEEVVVSAIRSGALEKLRKKPILLISDSFSWVYSPKTNELFIAPKKFDFDQQEAMKDSVEDFDMEEFLSVNSCFSCCSSVASKDVFDSVKTSFSRSSSFNNGGNEADSKELQWRSMMQEFCHCEGWPFGLCRKAVLLPPLPKSPSESWSWRKGTQSTLKLTYQC